MCFGVMFYVCSVRKEGLTPPSLYLPGSTGVYSNMALPNSTDQDNENKRQAALGGTEV